MHNDLNLLEKVLREAYADLSVVLLLNLPYDDFLEAYLVSEGCEPEAENINSYLLNRIALVVRVVRELPCDSDKIGGFNTDTWKEEPRGEIVAENESFIGTLKEKVQEYL